MKTTHGDEESGLGGYRIEKDRHRRGAYYSDEESPRRIDLQDDEWNGFEEWLEKQRSCEVKGGQGRSAPSLVFSAWILAFLLGAGLWVLVWAVVMGAK